MRETYGLDESLTDQEVRDLAGVLYELELRSREITYSTYVFAEDVDIDFITKVKERGLSGVNIVATSVREYNTSYAAHLLGRVGPIYSEEWEYYQSLDVDGDGTPDYQMDDTVGKDGVELAFESYLKGTAGQRAINTNTDGKVVSQYWLTDSETGETLEPEPGGNVSLTIDIRLQEAAERALANGIESLESEYT